MTSKSGLVTRASDVDEINERYWALLVQKLGWPLERNANSIAYGERVNAAAPSRRHKLRTGLMKDGAGQLWRWSGTPGIYTSLKTGEEKRNDDIPTPCVSGTFPEETIGWVLCRRDEESEVEKNERSIAQLELANVAIRDFIATMKGRMCDLMYVRATETYSFRVAYAALRAREEWPAEGEWSNRRDPPAIVAALNLPAKSLAHEFTSDGAIIGVMLNWLEELSGLSSETYLH